MLYLGFPGGTRGKEPACQCREKRDGFNPSWEDPLEKSMATQSSSLDWIIPWTEESGRLWSIGLQSQTCLKQLSMHMLLSTSYNTMLFIKNNKVIKKENYR